MEEVFFAFKNAKIVEKNSVSSNTLRQHLHLRMIIMYLIKSPIYSPMVIKGGGKKSGKMMYRVYIDVIFAVNFLMDLAVLAMLNQLFSYRADFKHMLKGAFVGALWACILAAFPGIPLILQMFGTYVAAGALMAAVAYGIRNRREILRAVGGIYLISVVLGGVMLALAESSPGRNLTKWMPESFLVRLFLAAGAVCMCVWFSRFLRLFSIRKEENRHLRNVTLFYAGQTIKTRGLIDTGNHLRAPVSGLPVHVATAGLMKRLCPAVKGVMYVPYQCIGSSGILPAVRIDEMKVEGEKGSFVIPKPWIAITKGSLSPHNEYELLIQKNDKGLQV